MQRTLRKTWPPREVSPKPIFAAAVCVLVLGGCASVPEPSTPPSPHDSLFPLFDSFWWDTVPAVTGNTLFRPPSSAQYRGASCTRLIRLEHSGSANGRLLATFEYFEADGMPIFESLDDGRTWSTTPIATVKDQVHVPANGWSLEWQPDLFEVPQQTGNLAAGTLLLAGNAVRFDANYNALEQQLQLYSSTDLGRTWRYRSTIASSPVGGGGVWEPNLQVAANGALMVYYADETHKAAGYNQLIGHKVSTDGGRSWGAETYDVALADGRHRPGMPVVARLPSGRYVMSYELVVFAERTTAPVYVKLSEDGLSWGDPADLGLLVRGESGAFLESTPFMTWCPTGGAEGTLVLSAMHVIGGTPGRKLLLNRLGGQGAWSEMVAPVQFRGGNDHAGWSQGLLPTADGGGVLHLAPSKGSPHETEKIVR